MLIRTIVLLFIILLEIKILFSDNVIQLYCKNTMDGSKHIFEIYKNYKVVNILPNGYQFDYSIDYENKSEVKAYFIQKKNNFIKKFILTFNINKNLITRSNKRCFNYRSRILQLSQKVGALHIGGSFSSVEILDVIFNYLKKKNDRFILSKGHCGILQYVILEDKKIISKKFLESYCQKNSKLGVHPDYGNPGIEASTGSLGHGLSVATGFALAAKRKSLNFNSYALLSDGELDEGSNWEAILFAPHHNLNNLTCIVDYNKLQSLTSVKETLNLEPLVDKILSFGWDVFDIDGHNHDDIKNAIKAKTSKPKFIIANTTKGKGISFMENKVVWHYRSPNEDELIKGLKELEE